MGKLSTALAILFGLAFVAILAIALLGYLRPAAPGMEAVSVQEFVPGLKRWPGDYAGRSKPLIAAPRPLGEPDVTITIQVMTPAFVPNVVKVRQGQVVKLILKGLDDGVLPEITGLKEFSGHGFQILGPYDVWVTGLRKGVVKEVMFVAKYPGEFDFECTVFCSPQHYLMRGKLIVEPAG